MRYFRLAARVVVLGIALCACEPSPGTAAAPPAPLPGAAPAPPAKPMVMICKNSQTGADAKCGTPNAVMVGMKPK